MLVVGLSTSEALAAETLEISFNRDIRPILSEHCFACHGPDDGQRKAGLRFDVEGEAKRKLKSGSKAIVNGNSGASELVIRIFTSDPDDIMPPAEHGKPLDTNQKQLLKQWIDQGAQWEGHWAYISPERPTLPQIDDQDWPRNPIDHFIKAKHEAENLPTSPEAPKSKLIRRASLDLTGLPPTVEEIDAFLQDDSDEAYDDLIDRLLESEHYGERQAMFWLDLARYGETQGFHHDRHRDMWHWRDWVIDAYNQNKPFDEFTVEQLAGDLLPEPSPDQLVATGFHRNEMTTSEGGALPEEYSVKYVVGRVDTTARVWLGTSLACAECHDHKYDPISQEDYYRFFAYFNNVPEDGLDRSMNPRPKIYLSSDDQKKQLAQLTQEQKALELAHSGLVNPANEDYDSKQRTWETELKAIGYDAWQPVTPTQTKTRSGSSLVWNDAAIITARGTLPQKDEYTLRFKLPQDAITGVRLEAIPLSDSPHGKAGRHPEGDFILTRFEARSVPADSAEEPAPIKIKRAAASSERSRYGISGTLDEKIETGWSVWGEGEQGKTTEFAWFQFENPIESSANGEIEVTLNFNSPLKERSLGQFRISFTRNEALDRWTQLPQGIRSHLTTHFTGRSDQTSRAVQVYYREQFVDEAKQLKKLLDEKRTQRNNYENSLPIAMVMGEREKRKDTFMLIRGEYNNPGRKVEPGVPSALFPARSEIEPSRLALAKWLVDPAHPLTSRVIVNHYWQQFFGTGIVKTSEDFGSQGEWPSHPQLLDWLAREFVESGWDIKHIHKLILTSATYRQDSTALPEHLQRDPQNRFLARYPRLRLEAEAIRDNALAIGGILNRKIGGPSIYPYQPPGLWEQVAFQGTRKWQQSSGEDNYRRGLYVYWRRSVPYASFVTFDAPSRETCTVKRPRTNTPLQALALMNDPVYVEAARAFGQRMMQHPADTLEARIRFAFQTALGRQPNANELGQLHIAYLEELKHFEADRAAANQLIHVGASEPPLEVDICELAAWTMIGNILLNLDETITKG